MNAGHATVAAAFGDMAARMGDAPFQYVPSGTAAAYGIPAGPISWRQAARETGLIRDAFAAAGYGPGHRIGLMLENRPSFFFYWLALNGLGCAVVPLSADLRPAELDYLVTHSEIVLAVTTEAHRDRPCAAVIEAGGTPPPAPRPATDTRPDRTRECALLYTSGTTGRPKGCVLSNDYFLRAGEWYAAIGGLCDLHAGARLITPLPLTHMNAMAYSSMAMILTGGCIVQLDRFHPRTWWDTVRESEATIVHYLGVMPSMLLGAPPEPSDRDHRVRFGFGAGVDRRHHATFETRFGFPLLEAWAMTETGAGAVVIANREPRHIGTNCFGRPEPAVETRILPEDGELLVRAAGPDPCAGFFTEYLKDPDATSTAWAGGWFHTGDIVRVGDDGEMYFVDRKKNVIRRSGENISAVEVESILRRHPAVAEAAVAAVPDELREEEVFACVVLRAPAADPAATAADIVRSALEDLSYFKVPGWVCFVESLPLTASQKVARGDLKTMASRLVTSPDCIDTRGLKRR